MLDKTSKQILEYLYNYSDYTFHANHGYPEQFTQADFLAAIDFLEENGYVSTTRGRYRSLISATLTHKGRHQKEFNSIALKRYLLDKWIDLLALIISVLAFVGAYRHEISALLQLVMQALIK